MSKSAEILEIGNSGFDMGGAPSSIPIAVPTRNWIPDVNKNAGFFPILTWWRFLIPKL